MTHTSKRVVAGFQAICPTLEAATKGATSYANLFDNVISAQIFVLPNGECPCSKHENQKWSYSFAVFGYLENGPPVRMTLDNKLIEPDSLDDGDYICERPMPGGTIFMYRRTTADIKALIAHLSEIGVPFPEALTPGFWRTRAACTGSTNCSTKSCNVGSCSTCNLGNGNYCCC